MADIEEATILGHYTRISFTNMAAIQESTSPIKLYLYGHNTGSTLAYRVIIQEAPLPIQWVTFLVGS